MRGRLPESIRLRPKTPLPGDAVFERLQHADARWVDEYEATPSLAKYVDRSAVPEIAGTGKGDTIWSDLLPLCLNFWLQQVGTPRSMSRREEHHEAI